MPINPTTKVSASTFQQCDGTNFTTVGVENSFKAGSGCVGTYTGIGLSFDGKPANAVLDVKGSVPYGDSIVSGGFRVRNNLGENSQTVQFRIQPATVTVPVGEKTNLYATPYVATKVNYKTGETSTQGGIFGGVSQKVGKASIFVEGQIYDATKINASTTSINVGVSIPIN
ncbi:hypothetical protein HDR58_05660 [bacterium]|nr:hypothetical protein [bacterium]